MKNKYLAAVLAFFLGGLGVHKFYLGKWTGVIYLVFCWTYIPSIIAFVESLMLLFMNANEFNEKYNKDTYYSSPINQEYSTSSPQEDQRGSNNKKSKYCSVCGRSNELMSNFCEACGTKF